MTRRVRSVPPTASTGKPALLQPLRVGRNLTDRVAARMATEIRSGRLLPGARLPTEQTLMAAMGISRTVVREAVAALRAEGLLIARQGSGVFVATDTSRVPFRIDPDGLSSIDNVLEIMELRLAIEVEAAALAAERSTPQTVASIKTALDAIGVAIRKGESAISEDFALHRVIAQSSGNRRFAELLEFLGRHVIPRQSIRVALNTPAEQRGYLLRIQKEHHDIFSAIMSGNASRARKAMRTHLTRSLRRYRTLAERHHAGGEQM
jgi:GntR family transcriptional regulator, transcriptional repressor for pyruvate dehydrogenase complex